MDYGVRVDGNGEVMATLDTTGTLPSDYAIRNIAADKRQQVESRKVRLVGGEWVKKSDRA